MWYEWRMKLLEGLKSVLLRIGEGMDEDDRSLTQQEQILQPVLPGLIEKHDRMESHVQTSQAQADEMADCDQDELKEARNSLAVSERDLGAKRKLVEELQDQLREREDGLEYVVTRKQECVEDIKEAEKIRQDSRGWSSSEVSALQGKLQTHLMLSRMVHTYRCDSQRPRTRRDMWLVYHVSRRLSRHNDLPPHAAAILDPVLF